MKLKLRRALFIIPIGFIFFSCTNASLKGTEWKSVEGNGSPNKYGVIIFTSDSRGTIKTYVNGTIDDIEDFDYHFDKETSSCIVRFDDSNIWEHSFKIDGKQMIEDGEVIATRIN